MGLINFLLIIGLFLYLRHLSNKVDSLQQGQTGVSASAAKPFARASTMQDSPEPAQVFAMPISPLPASRSEVPAGKSFDSTSFIEMLPKIGMVALVIGLGFFLKYAIDQGWVSVNLRLFIGGAIGTLLLILFYLWREKYEKYAMALAGGGLAIWYLTIFAAVQLYSVMTTDAGFAVLIVVTLVGLLLAYKTHSKVLAAMSWGGAYLVPIILNVGSQEYALLLTYLTVVSAALLTSVFYNEERYLFILALCGSALNLLAANLNTRGDHQQYLQTLLFLLIHIFLHTILLAFAIRKEDPKKEHANQREYSLMFGLTYLFLAVPMGIIAFSEFRDLAPMIMLALGAWTFLTYAFIDRLEFTNINYALSGLGAGALSLAIFWQFGDSSQVVVLYLLGLVGLIVGRIQGRAELRVWGLIVIMLGIVSAFGLNYSAWFPTFLFNEKFGLEVLGLGAMFAAYKIFPEQALTNFENNIHDAIQYIIAILFWIFVSWDLVNYFGQYGQENQRNLSLSLWWIVYAVVLTFVAATRQGLKPLRKLGLFLFGLVILKVFLYDLQSLETVYRIISFISLGVILLVVSFAYQRNKDKIKHYLES